MEPVSQDCGESQGREETFSDSVVPQPVIPSAKEARQRNNAQQGLEK